MGKADLGIEVLARGLVIVGDWALVCRNVAAGYGYLPGGHIEPGEAAAVALRRELLEEAGADWRIGECLVVAENRFVQGGRDRHELNMLFHVEHGLARDGAIPPPPVLSLETHIAFDWVPRAAFAGADVRPAWMRDLVVRNWEVWSRQTGVEHRPPLWVSEGFSGAWR